VRPAPATPGYQSAATDRRHLVTNRIQGLDAWLLPPWAVILHHSRRSGRHYRRRSEKGPMIPKAPSEHTRVGAITRSRVHKGVRDQFPGGSAGGPMSLCQRWSLR
jgi:hypothetical protein